MRRLCPNLVLTRGNRICFASDRTSGYRPGEDIWISMDAAASEFYNAEEKVYHFHQSTGEKLNSDDMVAFGKIGLRSIQ